MVPLKLYKICLQRICDFLTEGLWGTCSANPFSSMPPILIDDLVSTMLSSSDRFSINDLCLLIKSCRLRHFYLTEVKFREGPGPLLTLLLEGCKELRTLSLNCWDMYKDRHYLRSEASKALETLLPNCPNLEDLHSAFFFNPDKLRNCRKLRCLRLDIRYDEVLDFFGNHTLDVWQHLKDLEVFSLSRNSYFIQNTCPHQIVCKHLAEIMVNCRKLTFLGFFDSSLAIESLFQSNRGPRQFQLRKCYWGHKLYDVREEVYYSSKCNFLDRISNSVLACPLVQELIFDVHYKDSLKYLSNLKNLTLLDVEFSHRLRGYLPSFYSLLYEIGSQLQYLRICTYFMCKFNLTLIIDSCRKLESLVLIGGTVVNEPVDLSASPFHLKRLSLSQCCPNSLPFLLSNCAYLKELCLHANDILDDDTLMKILGKNPLSELQVMFMRKCSLSKEGLRMFLRSARSLEDFGFYSPAISDWDVRSIVNELNPGIKYRNALKNFSDYFFFDKQFMYRRFTC